MLRIVRTVTPKAAESENARSVAYAHVLEGVQAWPLVD
jgi:hypothetical protein